MTLNPTVDVSTSVDQVVAERKLRCDAPVPEPGGGGINVARVARELGVDATALWTRGGATGARLEGLLDELGLEHRPLPIAGETREHLIVYERSTGRQFRFGMPGPVLDEAELASCVAAVAALDPSPAFLVLSGSLPDAVPDDFYARLVRAAPPGCRVALDTSDAALAEGVQASPYLVKPNRRELGALTGAPVEDDDDVRTAARRLLDEHGVAVVVTSLGAGGVIATSADGDWLAHAPPVRVRSAVGAGDSMVAALVVALARGDALDEAVRWGVATGTATVLTEGTQLCRRADVDRLYRKVDVRSL
ncbi:MAG: 1-phosphofructokinase family hexose kinase [Trueperaceae bacterium]